VSDAQILFLRATGWTAAALFVVALAATPLGRVPRLDMLPRWRRGLGIWAACAALAHFATAFTVYLPRDFWSAITTVTWLRSGALALAVLVAMLVTSFPVVVRALRIVLWKPLHRLAYVAAPLVVHHLLLAPFVPRAWAFAFAAVLALLFAARLVPRRDADGAP
jgi:sulfoxide reductase heme-binding subunit YedZ